MATRLGIELTSAACRIIEIDTGSGWRRARAPRVRSFAVLPSSGPEIGARLASYKGRAASVIVWGPYNAHRQVVVTRGTYESMRTDALESLSRAGVETRGVFVDIAPVGPSGDKAERRPVVVALAAATPIMSALQPIIDAGIRVRSVATPATALSSLARLRRSLDAPGIEAYVAVEEDATCIAPLPPPRVLENTPAAVPPREGRESSGCAVAPASRDDLAFHRAVDPFGAFHGPAGGVASGRGRLPVRDATGVHSTARLASADPSKTSRDGHAV